MLQLGFGTERRHLEKQKYISSTLILQHVIIY